MQVFALDAGELIAQACGRHPRALTAAEWTHYLGAASPRDACDRALAADAPQ